MCRPEMTQDYVVLRALDEAGKPINLGELYSRVADILKPIGHKEVNDLAARDLADIVLEFHISDFVKRGSDGKYQSTAEGRTMGELFKTWVKDDTPQLVA